MDAFESALRLLPVRFLSQARRLGASAEEYRLRLGRSLSAVTAAGELFFEGDALTETELTACMERATGASVHTAAPALARGYLSCRGLRIGVCGETVWRDGALSGYRHVSSLAIRLPRECRGVLDAVLPELFGRTGFQNTLLLSPPGGGKTTALRELIRCLSEKGKRVAVLDERGELSAPDGGRAQFDLGRRSDVLLGCPKREGSMLLIRGMNPDILAMDEITEPGDLEALRTACGCGVGLIATAHASSAEELGRRPVYRALLELGCFQRCLTIRATPAGRCYEPGRLGA